MKLRPFACVNTRTVCFCIITQLPPERRSVILSGSVSPLPWTGSKGCIYTTIDAFMPPHKTYVEACMGSAEVFLRKKPVERELKGCSLPDIIRRNTNIDGNPLRDIIIVIIGLSGLGKVIIVFGIDLNIDAFFGLCLGLLLF